MQKPDGEERRRSFLRPAQSAWEQALESFRVELRERLDRERPDASSEAKDQIVRSAVATYEEGLRKLVGRSSAGQEALAIRLIQEEATGVSGVWAWRRLKERLVHIFSPGS